MNNEDKNPESESNVWASYSDLFTNVAIIFLVMFVFALVKSAVNQVQNVQTKKQHENELKAKLSPKDVTKNRERIAKVEKAVSEMKNYENVIDSKIQELNSYAKKLQDNKVLLKDMIESQEKQDSLLKVAEDKIKEQESLYKEKQIDLEMANLQARILAEELEKTKLEVKQREENAKREIQKETSVAKTIHKKLTETVTALSTQLETAQTKANQLATELNAESQKKQENSKIITSLQRQMENLEKELEKNRKTGSALAVEKSTLSESMVKLQNENSSLKTQYEKLTARNDANESTSKVMAKKLNELSSRISANEADAEKWKKEYNKTFGEAEKLKGDLADSQRRFQSLANTLKNLKDTVKNGVAMKLQEKFKEHNLDAKVNSKTGEVVLLSGEGFNFAKGSSALSPEAKQILKKLIPVYASVLLEDANMLKQISFISMEGHSSPSFAGKYIDVETMNPDAYSFNMRLSSIRAASVANYLMSKEIGDYPHKAKLKSLLQSVGYGYSKPVQAEINRLPASAETKTDECGPWDCFKSQRVQINFHLKDNMEEIHKIIDANGGIR